MKMRFVSTLSLLLLSSVACTAASLVPVEDGSGDQEAGIIDRPGTDAAADGSTRAPDAGGSHEDAGVDANEGDASPLYLTDPLSCGAKGHSCLGATCTAGVCEKEKIRGNVDWLTIDESGALVTLVQVGASTQLRRGPVTPNAADSVVFTLTSKESISGDWRAFKQGFLTEYLLNDDLLRQHTGSGGNAAVKSEIATRRTTRFAVDATHLFFSDFSRLYRVEHGGANRIPLAAATTFSTRAVAVDDTDLYVLHGEPPFTKLSRVPKGDGPVTSLAVTGLSNLGALQMVATPTHLVVRGFGVNGIASCGASTCALVWSVPKAGGAPTILSAFNGYTADVTVSGPYAYWTQRPPTVAAGNPNVILRRRIDGSDGVVTIANDSPSSFVDNLAVDGTHVYWSGFTSYRAPK